MRGKLGILIGATLLALSIAALGVGDARAGGGCHSDVLTDERGISVALQSSCFNPTVIRVQPGEQVTWTNNDPTAHTVTGVAASWGDYDELNQGESVSYTFETSGVYPYFCLLHPSMVGAVVVGDGSRSAVGAAGDGVRAVSAIAPGEGDGQTRDAPEGSTDSDGLDAPVVALIALGAAAVGAIAATAVRRLISH